MRQIRWDEPLYLPVKQNINLTASFETRLTTHPIPFEIKKSWNKGILCTGVIAAASLHRPSITPCSLSLTAEWFSRFLSMGVRSSLTETDWKSHFCVCDRQPKLTLPSAVGISLRQPAQTNATLLEIQFSLWEENEGEERMTMTGSLFCIRVTAHVFLESTLLQRPLAYMSYHCHAMWFLEPDWIWQSVIPSPSLCVITPAPTKNKNNPDSSFFRQIENEMSMVWQSAAANRAFELPMCTVSSLIRAYWPGPFCFFSILADRN